MRIMPLALLAVAAALPAIAQKFEVHVLPVESMDGLLKWAQTKPAPVGIYPRAKELALGKKIYMPILVSGLDPAAHGPLDLVGDLEIVGPDGKSQAMKKCCRFSAPDRAGLRFAILSNAPSFEMDATDPKGVYTLRASVTDGQQVAAATEQIPFGAAPKAAAAPTKPAAARSDATAPSEPAARRTFSHADRRNCLDLSSQREIIRCSEGK